ncbi:hypothetical protein PENSUB_10006 [Penicillium subrubescens]|uniref:Uncharacterized protein n=2 Tax=Penicillium subrubescens TaxID=1316194 RepID=A0A1Q5TBQ3_9EURO|nr:hypothetical protein PENSUB_10006 [Penicillium subrubescens]
MSEVCSLAFAEQLDLRPLSSPAWERCLQMLCFIELDDEQQQSVLEKLCRQAETDSAMVKLKQLLQFYRTEIDDGRFMRQLLERATTRNDTDLAYHCFLMDRHYVRTLGLILAVKDNRLGMIEYWLAQGADIDMSVSEEAHTALQIACCSGKISIVDLLLTFDKFQSTTLQAAVEYQCYTMVETLRGNGDFEEMKKCTDFFGRLPIQVAIDNADLKMVQLLASPIHVKDREGRNLLHIAVKCSVEAGEREEALENITKWLIDNGCDRTARNNGGHTPYEYARRLRAPSWVFDLLHVPVPGDSSNHPIVIPDDTPLDDAYTTSFAGDQLPASSCPSQSTDRCLKKRTPQNGIKYNLRKRQRRV